MATECPNCQKEFKRIGQHWVQSSDCNYPNLTQKQREITTGLLMGDGYIDNHGKNPRLLSEMITKEYLQYVEKEFGILGTSVSLVMTAEESSEEARSSGLNPNAQSENYSDKYRWGSRRHPEFEEFTEWYSTGEKVWPENIELTPTVLKHWYCGDGSWCNGRKCNNIKISMTNEVEHTKKVDKLFKNADLPSPSNYSICKRRGGKECEAHFTLEQSKELWAYMGEPLPGFEYKWPEEFK